MPTQLHEPTASQIQAVLDAEQRLVGHEITEWDRAYAIAYAVLNTPRTDPPGPVRSR